ncbi:uncharacterized protein TNCV_1491761 [Trichonephila clavipes]|nr:uncharacterized protein TNCV_1491761 [Trichonephila clavipes]
MALGGSLPHINLGVQGETQGGHHSGTQRVNPEFKVGSNFRIIPEQYFSGSENVTEFLENIDNNLTYYEIPTQLACAYLKSHLTGRALDCRLEPQILDYVEVRHPQTTSNLLQIIDKYEQRFLNRRIRGSSWELRDTNPSENDRFINRNRQENWRETRGNNRYSDNSRPRREFNRFECQGVADNRRFDGQRRGGQSDNRFHNQGGRQGGSRNSSFRENPPDTEHRTIRISSLRMTPIDLPYIPILLNETFITALWNTRAEKSFISEEVYRKYFSYRPRQKTKYRVVTAHGAPCCHLGWVELKIRIREFQKTWEPIPMHFRH